MGTHTKQELQVRRGEEFGSTDEIALDEVIACGTVVEPGFCEECVVRRSSAGLDSLEGLAHRRVIAGELECAAVGETEPVVRVEAAEIEILLGAAADLFEQCRQDVGHQEERRSRVEAVPILLEDSATPAGLVVFLHDRYLMAAVLQARRDGETSEARSDDDDLFAIHPFLL